MDASNTQGTLLVPVANAETADRLMDTATDVAADRTHRIVITHVVEVPAQIPLSEGGRLVDEDERELLDRAATVAKRAGVPTETRVRLARDVATGITGAAEQYDADTILMGWRGRPPRRDVVLGNYLDVVLRNASCDVLVKRIRTLRPVADSVLVPVADGPHNELAAETAGRIARRHDASVHLLHVLPFDPSASKRERGRGLLREARSSLGEVSSVERELVENDHVAGIITDRTTEHDVTVVGTTQESLLRRKLVGTVSEAVGRHAANTVILTQRHLSKTSRLKRLVR